MSGITECPRCEVRDAYYEHVTGDTFWYDCRTCDESGDMKKDKLFD